MLTAGTPQVSKIAREHGQEAVNLVIEALIMRVAESVNVGKNMTPKQVQFAAELIADKYWYLKLEDFNLCFRKGILGDYGKLYDRLDVQILCDWIAQYEQERNNECAKLERDKGQQYMSEAISRISPADIEQVRLKLTEAQAAKSESKPTEKTEFEKWALSAWEKLPQHGQLYAVRYYRGKEIVQAEWHKMKHAQWQRVKERISKKSL